MSELLVRQKGRVRECGEGGVSGGSVKGGERENERREDPDPRFRWGSNGGRLTGSESLQSPADLVLPEAPFTRPSRSRPRLFGRHGRSSWSSSSPP